MTNIDNNRNAAIEGLRGVSIILVIIFHAGAPFLKGGGVGVDVFFVISGFLIKSLLTRERDRVGAINLRNFYMRRLLRLAPAFLLLIVVVCGAGLFFFSAQRLRDNFIDSLIAMFYMSNWARALDLHPPELLAHTWSLSIE